MSRRPLVPFRRPRKRGAARLFTLSALVVTAALGADPAAAQVATPPAATRPAEQLRFDIPAGPLDAALRAFEAATGLSVVVQLPADTVGMMTSPGLSGTYTLDAALEALLDGTSLAATRYGQRRDQHRRPRHPRVARGHRPAAPRRVAEVRDARCRPRRRPSR